MSRRYLLGALFPLGGIAASPRPAPAATDPTFAGQVQPFLRAHCYACHGPEKAKAGFRIDQLSADLAAPRAAEQWKEVIDRMNAGEMPPKKQPRPDARQAAAVVAWADARLREIDLAAKQ